MVAIEAFHVELFEKSMSAHHLNGVVAYLGGHFGAVKLGHSGLFAEGTVLILEPAGVIEQVTGSFNFHGHVGEFECHSLELAYGLAELHAFLGVGEGHLVGALGASEAHGGDGEST